MACIGALMVAPACARGPAHGTAGSTEAAWVGTWSAPPQLTEPRNLPPEPGLSGNTLRQVVHVSIGGRALRVRLSNEFGTSDVTVRAAHIAPSAGADTIVPAHDRALTFDGRATVVIPAGAAVTSDPLDMTVLPLADLAVSLHFGETSADVTGHPGSRTTSYLVSGDRTREAHLPDAARVERWYILAGIDVQPERPAGAVVTLGNSITDGRGSGTDRNNRWPDNLARRLQADPRTAHVAVLNAGIGGNAVLRGGLGPTALDRLERDVFAQHGVRWLIVSIGVNDIGGARDSAAASTVAAELIEAYRRIIARAREAEVRVYGATISPFAGSGYDSPARESARQTVNHWIRTSGVWDAVIDFDAALRDSAAPTRLRAELETGDHLHPNEAGYRVMADAIDLALLLPEDSFTLRLARYFQDGAVLQRDVRMPVWGWASPGATVHATLHGRTERTTADTAGRWQVVFPALAAGGPHELTVRAGAAQRTIRDLLIGDVWVAAGQSNMEWTVASANDAAREIAAADDRWIRRLKVPHAWADEPAEDLAAGTWAAADSAHVGTFTAVGYFFARALRPVLKVPIALLDVSWSGSAIETWLSREANGLTDAAWAEITARPQASRPPDGQRLNKVPSIAFNAMVHPLLGVPVRGVLWYQGESNANSVAQATAYRAQFDTLIRSWRGAWTGGHDLPFLWVQLPNFGRVDSVPPDSAGWATLRESQDAALALPRTGQVVAIDIGDAGDLHPGNKQDVGHRLALVARRVAYGETVEAASPRYRAHEVQGNRVVVSFHDEDGLVTRGDGGRVSGFAIAGADRRWVWAEARLEGTRVVVWSDRVPAPLAVRYAWADSPAGPDLYGKGGLPAAPFRTDRW